MTFSHGSFCWNELMTHDAGRAKKFYEDAIGWNFEAMNVDDMTYWVAKSGEHSVGGIFEMKGPDFDGVPEYWIPYLAVDDVDARVDKALADGATAMRTPFDVPAVGRIAILREPGGAVIGMMTPSP